MLLVALCLGPQQVLAFNLNRDENAPPDQKHLKVIPYGFYNGNTGFAAVAAVVAAVYVQRR